MRFNFYPLLAAFAMMLLPACEKEGNNIDNGKSIVTISATLENGRHWKAGDEVIINGNKYAVEVGEKSTISIENVTAADYYYAAYDFGQGTIEGTKLSFTLPDNLNLTTKSIQPMVASNGNNSLVFKNLMGKLRLAMSGNKTITRIVLSSLDNALAGTATAEMNFAGSPSIDMADDATRTITLNLGQGVELPQDFDIALPATSYSGFVVTVYGTGDELMSNYAIAATDIPRGDVTSVAVTYEPDTEAPTYVTATLENDAEGNANTWSNNSVLYINGVPASIVGGQGTANGEFGPISLADVYYASNSSASANGLSGQTMRIAIPATQNHSASIAAINPAVGKSTTNNIALSYLGGVATIKVSGPHSLRKASLAGKNNRRLAGSGVVDMSTATPRLSLNADASKEITVDCGTAGLNIENGATLRFVMPADNYSEGFTLTLTDNNGQTFSQEVAGATLSANTISPLGEVVWESAQGDGNNLSKLGYSNCYMVHMAGDYTFKTRLVDNTPVNNIAKVDWLWASKVDGKEGNALVSNISYADGTVSFTASEHEGNALLAAFDSEGNIVWSWHIWLTDMPEVYDYQNNVIPQSDGKTDGYYCMDRNLGATDATLWGGYETFGLYYQWGRKDPFIGDTTEEREQQYVAANGRYEWVEKVSVFGNSDKLTVCNTAYAQAKWQSIPTSSANNSIEYASANPMTFYSGGTGSQANWLDMKSLDPNIKNDIAYDMDKSLWRPFQKSNYDPCPVGYQVPRKAMWIYLDSYNSVYTDDGFVNTTTAGVEAWFPSSGCRSAHPTDGGSLIKVQKSTGCAFLWTSEIQASEQSFRFYYHAPMFEGMQSSGWGNGYNVRCVKQY